MPRWTLQQVTRTAPDASSLSAARTLARPGPWTETGATATLVWGVCQGGGATPYQVSVYLVGPAYRCSCPSRKFPCKHALALLLLWVESPEQIASVGEASGFAQDWAEARATNAAQHAPGPDGTPASAGPSGPADPAARAKRLTARLELMDAGMADFAVWLTDLVRSGLAAARQQPYAWWDGTAARLVDAQLPGLAEQVRTMASDVHRRADWADHLLAWCGRWWTATVAWTRRESLDDTELADLRVFVGWAQQSVDVRARDPGGIAGRWLVLGAHRSDDGRLQQQRTWLRSEATQEVVQVLDFAVTGTSLRAPQLAGSVIEVTVVRHPGSWPRRGLFVTEPVAVGSSAQLPDCGSVDAALSRSSERLATSPWSDRMPVSLGGISVVPGPPSYVVDRDGHRLDLVPETSLWMLLALTGGGSADAFGELDAGRLRLLSVRQDDSLVAV